MRPNKEPKRTKPTQSPTRTRPVSPSGSLHRTKLPPPPASLLSGEFVTEEFSRVDNPRSFPYNVKQQCWEKAEKIKGRL
ncbi:hypothetical protein Leryth_014243 [Lithospermum erythrorhizon]|nr:hypothetical protein Leryth_014243 [Lithospermum erythrorhizon]